MAEITAALVKELREKSGAGMMDCKKALIENDGDVEATIDWLRAKGIAKADKKSGRTAAEGLIGINGAGTSALTNEQCSPYTVHYAYDTVALAKGTGGAV
eukprot:gene2803-3295_t